MNRDDLELVFKIAGRLDSSFSSSIQTALSSIQRLSAGARGSTTRISEIAASVDPSQWQALADAIEKASKGNQDYARSSRELVANLRSMSETTQQLRANESQQTQLRATQLRQSAEVMRARGQELRLQAGLSRQQADSIKGEIKLQKDRVTAYGQAAKTATDAYQKQFAVSMKQFAQQRLDNLQARQGLAQNQARQQGARSAELYTQARLREAQADALVAANKVRSTAAQVRQNQVLQQANNLQARQRAAQTQQAGGGLSAATAVGLGALGGFAAGIAQRFFDSFVQGAKDAAAAMLDFGRSIFQTAAHMQVSQEQLVVLMRNLNGSAEEGRKIARDAVEFARKSALEAPFVRFEDSVEAVKKLTAAGLDYTRTLRIIQEAAAATVPELDDISKLGDRIRLISGAFAAIAAGATGRGIRSLREAGINVREAGIEFDRAGSAIGTSQEILDKLTRYMETRFRGALEDLNTTFPAIQQNTEDLIHQLQEAFGATTFEPLRVRLAKFFQDTILNEREFRGEMVSGAQILRAYFSILGEGAGQVLTGFFDMLKSASGYVDGAANDFYAGGTRVILSFAAGILEGANYVLAAVVNIVQTIANFLIGQSPPPEGPLSTIDKGGANTIRAWGDGIREGAAAAVGAARDAAQQVRGALAFGPNLAETFGRDISNLLQGALPSTGGLLGSLSLAGQQAADAYLDGFRAGFDLGPVQRILSTVESMLRYGVASEQIAEASFGAYLDTLTQILYRAALEVQEFGAVTAATLGAIGAEFGVLADNIQNIFAITGNIAQIDAAIAGMEEQIKAAEANVRAAEEGVQAAQDYVDSLEQAVTAAEKLARTREKEVDVARQAVEEIDKQIERLNLDQQEFNLRTEFLPDRLTRGRKREFEMQELSLRREKSLREERVKAAQAQVDAAQAEVERRREIVEASRQEVEAARRVVEERRKAVDALREQLAALQDQKREQQDLLKLEEQKLQALEKYLNQQKQALADDKLAKGSAGSLDGDSLDRGLVSQKIGGAAFGLSDQFDRLKEKVRDAIREMAPEEIERIKNAFKRFYEIVDSPALKNFGSNLGVIGRALRWLGTLVWDLIENEFKDLRETFELVGRVGGAVFRLLPEPLQNALTKIKEKITELWEKFKSGELFQPIITKERWEELVSSGRLFTLMREIGDGIKKWLEENAVRIAIKVIEIAARVNKVLTDLREYITAWLVHKATEIAIWFAERLTALVGWLSSLRDRVTTWFTERYVQLLGWLDSLYKSITKWIEDVKTAAKEWVDNLVARFAELVQDTLAKITQWASDIQAAAERIRDQAFKVVNDAVKSVIDWLTDLRDRGAQAVADAANKIVETAQGWARDWANALANLGKPITDMIDKIIRAIEWLKTLRREANNQPDIQQPSSGAGGGGGSSFDGGEPQQAYAAGGVVHRTGRAKVHEGEIILNYAQQRRVGRALAVSPFAGAVQIRHEWNVVPDLEDRLDLENRMKRATYDALSKVFKR